jgi:hypothetical protein
MIADPVPPRRLPRLAKPWSQPQVATVEIAIEIEIGIGIGIGIGIDTIMTLGHSPLDVHSLSIGGLEKVVARMTASLSRLGARGCQAPADQTIINDEGHDFDFDPDLDDDAEEPTPQILTAEVDARWINPLLPPAKRTNSRSSRSSRHG